MMRRIKVVTEPTDLVPVLRAFDTEVKRRVFAKLAEGPQSAGAIEREFGAEGVEALAFFEKTKLVATEWQPVAGKTEKVYQSYYTAFQLGVSASAQELPEILAAALMPEDEFRKLESEIDAMAGADGCSARAVTEKLGIPTVRLKGLLKRSSRLEMRGHIVKRLA